MLNQVSPAQSAKCILAAFPYAYAGAEVSLNQVERHFRRSGYPPADMPRGILYAAVSGWVERTEELVLRLTLGGVIAIGKQTPVPASIFSSWAHA